LRTLKPREKNGKYEILSRVAVAASGESEPQTSWMGPAPMWIIGSYLCDNAVADTAVS